MCMPVHGICSVGCCTDFRRCCDSSVREFCDSGSARMILLGAGYDDRDLLHHFIPENVFWNYRRRTDSDLPNMRIGPNL